MAKVLIGGNSKIRSITADVSVIPGQTIYWRAFATNEAGTTYTTITNITIN